MPITHALPLAFLAWTAAITAAAGLGILLEALKRRADLRSAARFLTRVDGAR